jgi:glycosyltransferase involved in cell wall biosynthesis
MILPLRVGLDARFTPGERGGVEQAALGLIHGLSQLTDGDEEYLCLIYAGTEDWIQPYLGGQCRVLPGPIVPRLPQPGYRRAVRSFLRRVWHQLSPVFGTHSVPLPRSDGTIERAGIEVMHFTNQLGFLTELPNIFQPWDLQHIHLPQFFTPRERQAREITFRAYCHQATRVVVPSHWGKRDLQQQYALPASKIAVIPAAPTPAIAVPTAADCEAVRRRHNLPEAFLLYPAQTWAHKNHLGLLDALARLRDEQQRVVTLICTGALNAFFPTIQRQLQALHLEQQVRFLGYVSSYELQCLYRLCRALIFPTKFEGFGLPLLEAFSAGVPVACSAVTCLPEIAAGAAVLFDPDQPAQIAGAIDRLWQDAALRQMLIQRGQIVAARYSWTQVARLFRAHYRQLARRPLLMDDKDLLVATDFNLGDTP